MHAVQIPCNQHSNCCTYFNENVTIRDAFTEKKKKKVLFRLQTPFFSTAALKRLISSSTQQVGLFPQRQTSGFSYFW